MRLLDLFCGAGGCSVGYHRAGFEVVGVDLSPQPNYPFEFHQADALEFDLAGFDAIHASPPCQFATAYKRSGKVKESPNLIPPIRQRLIAIGVPYVIENVEGARDELTAPLLLCGSMFGLDVQRHRLFESNIELPPPAPCAHSWPANRFPGGRSRERTGASSGLVRATVEVGSWDIPLSTQKQAMGIQWGIELHELSQAIPPAYTEWIGQALIQHLLLG